MDKLAFDLKPSLTKLGFMVGLFILLNAILSNYLGGIAFGLVMLACLMALYFVHDRNPVQQLAHLDQDIWSLKFKDGNVSQQNLISVQRLGFLIFLKFSNDEYGHYTLCVTQDQIDEIGWKRLNTLVELS